jgi:hypothetical protein
VKIMYDYSLSRGIIGQFNGSPKNA